MISQRSMVAASLAAVHHPDTYGSRHDAPAPKPKPCTAGCVRGMVTDLNGAQWKCSHCGGSGREPLQPPRVIPGTPRSS